MLLAEMHFLIYDITVGVHELHFLMAFYVSTMLKQKN